MWGVNKGSPPKRPLGGALPMVRCDGRTKVCAYGLPVNGKLTRERSVLVPLPCMDRRWVSQVATAAETSAICVTLVVRGNQPPLSTTSLLDLHTEDLDGLSFAFPTGCMESPNNKGD